MDLESKALTGVENFIATNVRLCTELKNKALRDFRINSQNRRMIQKLESELRDDLRRNAEDGITPQSHSNERFLLKNYVRNALGYTPEETPSITEAEDKDDEDLIYTTAPSSPVEDSGSSTSAMANISSTSQQPIGPITISISALGKSKWNAMPEMQRDLTFADLAAKMIRAQPNFPKPDFWCRRDKLPGMRCKNQFIWACQETTTPVVDALLQSFSSSFGGLGIEFVALKEQYVVVVVQKPGGMEFGRPIPFLKERLGAKAGEYLRGQLGSHVQTVYDLETGKDASEHLFNEEIFIPKTCPLFVPVD